MDAKARTSIRPELSVLPAGAMYQRFEPWEAVSAAAVDA
jgi:hypothetical protein